MKVLEISQPAEFTEQVAHEACNQLIDDGYVGIGISGPAPIGPEDIHQWVGDLTDHGELMLPAIHGIIKNFGIGQAPFMWKAREWVYPIYKAIWEKLGYDGPLVCSFDGANYSKYSPRARTYPESWLHRDQRESKTSFEMIQGVLELGIRSDKSGGNLVVVPDSHRVRLAGKKQEKDWVRVSFDDCEQPLKMIDCTSTYSITLWLWDSRTWHANRAPKIPDLTRTACYIAFGPEPIAKKHYAEKRLEFIKQGVTTSHWPHKLAKNSPPRFFHRSDKHVESSRLGKIVKPEEVIHLPFTGI